MNNAPSSSLDRSTSPAQTRQRRVRGASRRSRERGAALVEAAVVLPCMLVFLGCIMFAHDSYDLKMDIQMSTRAGVMYHASHACRGGVPGELWPSVTEVATANPGVDGPADSAVGKLDSQNNAALAAGLSKTYQVARAERSGPLVTRRSVFNGESTTLTRDSIRAGSSVGCNEGYAPSNWRGVIEAVAGYARGGGGGFP